MRRGFFIVHRLHPKGVIYRIMKRILCVIVALIASFSITKASTESWSQFRGPNGTGVSETKGIPDTFGPGKNVVWKTALPPGHSSPVLTNDRIFVTAHTNQQLLVICLDRKTGK